MRPTLELLGNMEASGALIKKTFLHLEEKTPNDQDFIKTRENMLEDEKGYFALLPNGNGENIRVDGLDDMRN